MLIHSHTDKTELLTTRSTLAFGYDAKVMYALQDRKEMIFV